MLKAKSGLSFDTSPENLEAAFENSKILLSNTIGIFSTKLKAIVRLKAGKCGGEIGAFLYNGKSGTFSIANSLKDYSEGNKTKYGLTKDVFFFVKDQYDGIVQLINSCSSNPYKIQKSPFNTFFKYLDILSKLQSAFDGGAHLADWLQFDKSIETCFQRNNNDVQSCNPLLGKWKLSGYTQKGVDLYNSPVGTCVDINGSCVYPIPNCVRDDTYTYGINGTLIWDEGPTKCNSTDPQQTTLNYTLNSTQTQITMGSETYNILILNSTTFKYQQPNSPDIQTFTRQ